MAETVTQNKPFKQFKKGYRILGREAPKLYKQTDSAPWRGDRIANFNDAQRDAFDMLGGLADANTEYSKNMLDVAGEIAGGDGLAKGTGQSLRWIDNVGSGQKQIETGRDYNMLGREYGQVANQMARLGSNVSDPDSIRYLKDMASGKYLDGNNRYLDDIVRQSNENVQNIVNARMAGSGTYGGSNYAKNITRELTDAEQRLRYQNYNDEAGRMLQANQIRDAAEQQKFNQRLGAAQAELGALAGKSGAIAGKTGVQGQNIANTLTAANQQAGILQQGQANRLAALGLSPNLQQTSLLGGQTLLGIGDRMQQQDQREADAQKQFYEEDRDQGWAQLGKLGQALGMGGQYGTQTQTQNSSWLETILGGLGLGAGLLGSIF